jgi:uncharacterized repeat protein (TIGR01451 family)
MSTERTFGRRWSRRKAVGATVVVALAVVSFLTLGSASGRTVAQHSSSDRVAASSATSSTHFVSRAQGHASSVSRSAQHLASSSSSTSKSSYSLLPALGAASNATSRSLAATITGCGADGSIADASGFEDADGNLAIDDTTDGCMDWNGFTPTWVGTAPFETGIASNNGFNFAGATDAVNSTSDSIYAGGVKQDTVCPGTVTGKANDKADLAAMYVASERIGNQVYLFLAWERQIDTTVQSDVFVSFEFNQSGVSCGAGSPFVQRTVGDLLFDYQFQSGNSTIVAEQWDGSTWQPLPTPPFEAAVNQGTVTDEIRPDAPVDLTQFEFGEAGINLTGLDLGGNGGKTCETFGSVLGGSRTSQSGDTAQLKDFVGPAPFDASNCVQPTATTTLKNAADDSTIADGSSIPFGSSVYDTTTLGNLVNGETPTGQVQYTFFTNGDCSGTGTSAGLVDLNPDGSVPPSDTEGPLNAGDYSFDAQYLSGDDPNYTDSAVSDCEPFTVLKNSPTLGTTPSESAGGTGDSLSDSATLSGAGGLDGTGTVTFYLYAPGTTCHDDGSGSPVYTNQVTGISSSGPISSGTFAGPLEAGTYEWVAIFSGDSNNDGATSGCGQEPVVITASPTITTTPSETSGSVGDLLNDSATLSDGSNFDGTGTIKFELFGPNDPNCDLQPVYTETVVADHNGSDYATSNSTVTANTAGTWNWTATFSGDGNNNPAFSECGDESVVISPAQIHVAKTADAAQVNVGSPIGFTLTVYNAGSGDANGVKLSDTLPTNAGLSWSIASQGAGWGGSCAIAAGKLTCGPVTVPAGTTQAASTFTVHITSPTTGATGGDCPTSGVVNNTGNVTADNASPSQSSASTCVQALVDLSVTKAGSPATQELGDGNITWTIVVTNNGPSAATGVTIADPMPAGNTFVSATSSQGSCTGGAILNCNIGTMAAGASVTITLVTTPSAAGAQTNTVTVAGSRPETNTSNNSATATVQVVAPHAPPPVFCVAVSKVTPTQLFVGRKTKLTIHVTKNKKAVKGIHVQIKGPKTNIRTAASNSKGVIKQTLKMKKAGILVFSPIASKKCNTKRVGVTGVFTPPVTG